MQISHAFKKFSHTVYRVFGKSILVHLEIITCVPLVGYIMEYCVIKIDALRWLSECHLPAWFMASSFRKSFAEKLWEKHVKNDVEMDAGSSGK